MGILVGNIHPDIGTLSHACAVSADHVVGIVCRADHISSILYRGLPNIPSLIVGARILHLRYVHLFLNRFIGCRQDLVRAESLDLIKTVSQRLDIPLFTIGGVGLIDLNVVIFTDACIFNSHPLLGIVRKGNHIVTVGKTGILAGDILTHSSLIDLGGPDLGQGTALRSKNDIRALLGLSAFDVKVLAAGDVHDGISISHLHHSEISTFHILLDVILVDRKIESGTVILDLVNIAVTDRFQDIALTVVGTVGTYLHICAGIGLALLRLHGVVTARSTAEDITAGELESGAANGLQSPLSIDSFILTCAQSDSFPVLHLPGIDANRIILVCLRTNVDTLVIL